ncbi:MAG: DUF4232 domain-containing protein [Cellulomonadaceae bacterium]
MKPLRAMAAGATAVGAVALALMGCTTPTTPAPPTAAPAPSEGELGPSWDEPPESPAVPDAELRAAELTALLRVPATAPADTSSCLPADLVLALGPADAALGHRYAAVVATNVSDRACTLRGYPGLGARGEWGTRFLLVVTQEPQAGADDPALAADPPPVTLDPGAQAFAPLQWTGELAGAESEHMSILVVQLAAQQDPVAVPAEPVRPDIGIQSTLDIAWWRLVDEE